MKIIECPRDAMQGLAGFIPTGLKVRYLSQLLRVGFDTLDAGSFVSPKAIPQMSDTSTVFDQLPLSSTRILAIIANLRGAEMACQHARVNDLGFPLSLSETFQQRNTRQSISDALALLAEIQHRCVASGKNLVVYISMGFGNPYGDPYHPDMVSSFVDQLSRLGVGTVSLADTVGVAQPQQIHELFSQLLKTHPAIQFGAHLHARPDRAAACITAALDAGCQRFDGALGGYGGCPMADDKLVGNVATETILSVLQSRGMAPSFDMTAWEQSRALAREVFPLH